MTSPAAPSPRDFHVPQLDVARCLAFGLVFIHHTSDFVPSDTPVIGTVFHKIGAIGWSGVDLFLVLSSFLICTLLLRETGRSGRFDWKNYALRRIYRIWPSYFVYLIFACGLLGSVFWLTHRITLAEFQDGSLGAGVAMVFMVENLRAGLFGFAPGFMLSAHLWTISLEEQFYVLFAILALGHRWKPLRNILGWTGAILILGGFVCRLVLSQSTQLSTAFFWMWPISRCDAFGAGMLMAALGAHQWKPSRTASLTLAILAAAGWAGWVALGASAHAKGPGLAWIYSASTLLSATTILAIIFNFPISSEAASRFWKYAGSLVYAAYIWHLFAILIARNLAGPLGLLIMPLALLVTIALAMANRHFVERPFENIRQRLRRNA